MAVCCTVLRGVFGVFCLGVVVLVGVVVELFVCG